MLVVDQVQYCSTYCTQLRLSFDLVRFDNFPDATCLKGGFEQQAPICADGYEGGHHLLQLGIRTVINNRK